MNETKICNGTYTHPRGIELPLSEFYVSNATRDGYRPYCKACTTAINSGARRRRKKQLKLEQMKAEGRLLQAGEPTPENPARPDQVDSDFILGEALGLYYLTEDLDQRVKLLEMMAKHSPAMKESNKPKDKTAIMNALIESLKREEKAEVLRDGIDESDDDA
jgi:hypothetical protein